MNDIPDWAGKRACELLNEGWKGTVMWSWPSEVGAHVVITVAKLVMQHETKPVDPDEEAVKSILIAAGVGPDEVTAPNFARAVSQYKQEKGNG